MELNTVIQGDCAEKMRSLDPKSVDLVFADPPYNLQLEKELKRPNDQKYQGVEDEWDKFASIDDYDTFTKNWLQQAKRVLKKEGSIWVIGTYHNIYRIGRIMQDIGFWILNDIVWIKTNPTPNFRGVRFNNAHETLIWAKKSKNSTYKFNYQMMKKINGGLQMRSDWLLPICQGEERIKIEGKKVHSTQKPESLLRRVILSSSEVGDVILDPFFGTGTTGAVAKKLKRNWIGIEKSDLYVQASRERIAKIKERDELPDSLFQTYSKKKLPKVNFASLIEVGLLSEGTQLFSKNKEFSAYIKADGYLSFQNMSGSIHSLAAHYRGQDRSNGWDYWFVDVDGELISIDLYRNRYRREFLGLDLETVI